MTVVVSRRNRLVKRKIVHTRHFGELNFEELYDAVMYAKSSKPTSSAALQFQHNDINPNTNESSLERFIDCLNIGIVVLDRSEKHFPSKCCSLWIVLRKTRRGFSVVRNGISGNTMFSSVDLNIPFLKDEISSRFPAVNHFVGLASSW